MLIGVRQSGRQLEEGPGLGDRFTLISLVFISILNLNEIPFHPIGLHLPPRVVTVKLAEGAGFARQEVQACLSISKF